MGKFTHSKEKPTMKKQFLKQVVNESIVDTKTNRYIYNTGEMETLSVYHWKS